MKLVKNANRYGHLHRADCSRQGLTVVPYEPALARTREEIVAALADDDEAPRPCVICLPRLLGEVMDVRRARAAAVKLGVTT